jgi:hypothetical protein
VTLTVPESEGQEETRSTTVANDESKRWRGGKGSQVRMDERMNFAYCCILEGGTVRQICQKVMDRFGVSEITAHRDYKRATELLTTEQTETRENLLNQIQALRLATVHKAVIGEAAPEQQAAAAPVLRVEIDDKRSAES